MGRSAGVALLAGVALDEALGDPARLHPVAGFGAAAAAAERVVYRPSRASGAAYAAAAGRAPHRAGRRACSAGSAGARRWPPPAWRSRSAGARCGAPPCAWPTCSTRAASRTPARSPPRSSRGALTGSAPTSWRAPPSSRWPRTPPTPSPARSCGPPSRARRAPSPTARPTRSTPWSAIATSATAPSAGPRRASTTRSTGPSPGSRPRPPWPPRRWPAPTPARRPSAWRRDGHRHPSPNGGQVEAAFAGALGVRLGGANRYGDAIEHRPHLGDGPRAGHRRHPPRRAAVGLRRLAAGRRPRPRGREARVSLTVVLGARRSGKSAVAERLAIAHRRPGGLPRAAHRHRPRAAGAGRARTARGARRSGARSSRTTR